MVFKFDAEPDEHWKEEEEGHSHDDLPFTLVNFNQAFVLCILGKYYRAQSEYTTIIVSQECEVLCQHYLMVALCHRASNKFKQCT